jgi:hypothetical protein
MPALLAYSISNICCTTANASSAAVAVRTAAANAQRAVLVTTVAGDMLAIV